MRLSTFAAALLIHFAAAAQTAPVASPAAAAPAATVPADVELAADVHMDSIRFGSAPRAGVRVRGGPPLEPRHDVERGDLPEPVATGRTYRNVTVRTTISATLLDPSLAADGQTPAPPAPASSPTDPEDSP